MVEKSSLEVVIARGNPELVHAARFLDRHMDDGASLHLEAFARTIALVGFAQGDFAVLVDFLDQEILHRAVILRQLHCLEVRSLLGIGHGCSIG